jgi:hypothetical protein
MKIIKNNNLVDRMDKLRHYSIMEMVNGGVEGHAGIRTQAGIACPVDHSFLT